jgi:PDDEXK-like uncharacterized protein DUF3799
MTARDYYRGRTGWVAPKPAPEPRTGLRFDVPEAEYLADRASLSASGAKLLLDAPARYKWRLDHPEHKAVYDEGSAAHALVLGQPVDSLVYVAPYDSWRTKAAQEEQTLARESGWAPILPAQWERVCDMADVLATHDTAMQLLSGGHAEVSAYAVDEPTGIMRRCRADYLTEGIIADYKTAQSARPWAFARAAGEFDYHLSAAWYLDVLTACGWDARAFAYVVQEKEPPYLVSVCEWDADSLDVGRRRARRALDLYARCVATDTWPGYQEPGTITPIRLPAWHFTEES